MNSYFSKIFSGTRQIFIKSRLTRLSTKIPNTIINIVFSHTGKEIEGTCDRFEIDGLFPSTVFIIKDISNTILYNDIFIVGEHRYIVNIIPYNLDDVDDDSFVIHIRNIYRNILKTLTFNYECIHNDIVKIAELLLTYYTINELVYNMSIEDFLSIDWNISDESKLIDSCRNAIQDENNFRNADINNVEYLLDDLGILDYLR